MAAGPTVKQIMEAYPGKIRLVIKNYPYKYRDFSRIAAEASLAAGDQGKYFLGPWLYDRRDNRT